MWQSGAVTTRKYDQQLRAESAEDTRRRILDAVSTRLREAPTEPLSLDQVARLAKVARSTIYTVFGSRAGLFDAFTEDLFARTRLVDLTRAVAAGDARTHLRGGLLAACRMYARDRDIYRVLHSMAQLDPDSVGGAVARMNAERRGGMDALATHLAEDGELRDDVAVAQATDLLWMLCSFDAFDLLYSGRGLSVDDTAQWLASTVERTLCR
jgi:AcrR family transcriptional regulator